MNRGKERLLLQILQWQSFFSLKTTNVLGAQVSISEILIYSSNLAEKLIRGMQVSYIKNIENTSLVLFFMI